MSVYGLMGVIMLVGLVVNNAIVIIDYAEIARRRGWNRTTPSSKPVKLRLRPILMADATSVIAMTPCHGSGCGRLVPFAHGHRCHRRPYCRRCAGTAGHPACLQAGMAVEKAIRLRDPGAGYSRMNPNILPIERPWPSKLFVEVTTACNLRCAMCVKQSGPGIADDFLSKRHSRDSYRRFLPLRP